MERRCLHLRRGGLGMYNDTVFLRGRVNAAQQIVLLSRATSTSTSTSDQVSRVHIDTILVVPKRREMSKLDADF